MPKHISEATRLSNGVMMPWLGLGVWRVEEGPEVKSAVRTALGLGYRSIDTATLYQNEQGVGEAIRESGIPREDIFVTTKVWNSEQGYQSTLKAFEESRMKLGIDVVDLYLVHWPVKGKYKETWKALEELYAQGKVRAIGVSNFLVHQLQDLMQDCTVKPMVNQVEYHPLLQQPELLQFCKREGIQLEAWRPIMGGRLDVPLLVELAAKYGKSPAQIVLRWELQQGVVVIPKSVKPERIRENADVFDFELSADDMQRMAGLDEHHRFGADPDNFDF